VEGPAARAPKSLNACAATKEIATAAKPQLQPAVQGAPRFYHPVSDARAGEWLPSIRRSHRSIGSNLVGQNREVGPTAKLTNAYCSATRGGARPPSGPPPWVSLPRCGRAYLATAAA